MGLSSKVYASWRDKKHLHTDSTIEKEDTVLNTSLTALSTAVSERTHEHQT